MRSSGPYLSSLSALTIGSLALTPTFDADVTEYTCSTSNATNKVTATPTVEGDEIEILNGETEIENAHSASWSEGENTLTITVGTGSGATVYTVTATYTPPTPAVDEE